MSGDRLRVTVQLVSTGDGYQVWSRRYDRTSEDVFAVQDEIAREIAACCGSAQQTSRESGRQQANEFRSV